MSGSQFGIIGLGTMGANLALNMESHGVSVSVWNLEPERVTEFLRGNPGRRFTPTATFEELVASLEKPRRILMMIPAGDPVEVTIGKLQPLLEPGDVLIDGGNSWFQDTERREAALRKSGIFFVGCGVSGGEEGARNGPSLMPGGAPEAWAIVRDVFEAIAAQTEAGPCVTHVGPGGAGHFVKMVHNGIEYGDMQLIAEAWDVLRRGLSMTAEEAAAVFDAWNDGPLESFLTELTARVGRVVDLRTGEALVDRVLDKAGQKGTGKWTAQVALDLGVPIPTIAAAIDARVLSSLKDERVTASAALTGPEPSAAFERERRPDIVEALEDAFYASRVCTYAQGMALIRAGSSHYRWGIDLAEIGRIWKGGLYHPRAPARSRPPCICRAARSAEPAARSRAWRCG